MGVKTNGVFYRVNSDICSQEHEGKTSKVVGRGERENKAEREREREREIRGCVGLNHFPQKVGLLWGH